MTASRSTVLSYNPVSMRRLSVVIQLLVLLSVNFIAQDKSTRASLPETRGSYSVARTNVLWTDTARHENPASSSGAPRHIPAYIYYPGTGGPKTAEYLPNLTKLAGRANTAPLAAQFGEAWRLVEANAVGTHSFEDTPLPRGQQKFPVLLFSPGMGLPVAAYSAQLENLASDGYIVVALEHPYDTALVALPDGTVVAATPEQDAGPPNLAGIKKELAKEDVWVADTNFVLHHIGKLAAQRSQFKNRLDLQRIGIFGHSMGGKVAVRLCQTETELRGCLNEDGGLFNADAQTLEVVPEVEPSKGTHAPLFNIDVKFVIPPIPDEKVRAQIGMWQKTKAEALATFLADNRSATYSVAVDVPGFSHFSFTDIPYLSAVASGGDIKSATSNLALANTFAAAFFDAVVKNKLEGLKALMAQPPAGVSFSETSGAVKK
jgi:pimeloyl-ACP methyl ester carboxylesterase